ncbi:MAG: hypothetical protein RMY36_032860 [Nostoc sp. SerVER01]|nr:hypothetical protein [Nostoc sp. SerVER01]
MAIVCAITGFNKPQSLPALPGESVSVDVEVFSPNKKVSDIFLENFKGEVYAF